MLFVQFQFTGPFVIKVIAIKAKLWAENAVQYNKRRIISVLLILTMVLSVSFAFATSPVEAKSPSKYTWSEKAAPNYVVKAGKAKVSGKPAKGIIKYSNLDKYGRTRRAVGNITYKMVKDSAGWREEFAELNYGQKMPYSITISEK